MAYIVRVVRLVSTPVAVWYGSQPRQTKKKRSTRLGVPPPYSAILLALSVILNGTFYEGAKLLKGKPIVWYEVSKFSVFIRFGLFVT